MPTYTLLTDGSSDRVLMPILDWLLVRHGVTFLQGSWADLRALVPRPVLLAERIAAALEVYPCDLLFVHRDAEAHPYAARKQEILDALGGSSSGPAICIVPIRMQETWLLFDESAIRGAAGNPNGRVPLSIPRISDLEGMPEPKAVLHNLLRDASGLPRRRRFNPQLHAHRVSELIEDFSPLLQLSAFERLDRDVREIVRSQSWDQ
jgi:hypothetical protein